MNNPNTLKKPKYSILFSLITLVLLTSACQKEDALDFPETSKKSNNQMITFCHYDKIKRVYEVITAGPKDFKRIYTNGDVILDDADGDGYYPDNGCRYVPFGDCDDDNAAVHPNAPEICGNNIDNNCNDLMGDDDPDCQGCQEVCTGNVEIGILSADIICPPFSTSSIGWEITVINKGEQQADRFSAVLAWLSFDEQLGNDKFAGGRIINTNLETCAETSFFFGDNAGDPTLYNFLLLQLRPDTDQIDCDMSNNLVAIPIPLNYPSSHCGN